MKHLYGHFRAGRAVAVAAVLGMVSSSIGAGPAFGAEVSDTSDTFDTSASVLSEKVFIDDESKLNVIYDDPDVIFASSADIACENAYLSENLTERYDGSSLINLSPAYTSDSIYISCPDTQGDNYAQEGEGASSYSDVDQEQGDSFNDDSDWHDDFGGHEYDDANDEFDAEDYFSEDEGDEQNAYSGVNSGIQDSGDDFLNGDSENAVFYSDEQNDLSGLKIYLYVQGNSDGNDWVYSSLITDLSTDICISSDQIKDQYNSNIPITEETSAEETSDDEASAGEKASNDSFINYQSDNSSALQPLSTSPDLSDCKIWLETSYQGKPYAVMGARYYTVSVTGGSFFNEASDKVISISAGCQAVKAGEMVEISADQPQGDAEFLMWKTDAGDNLNIDLSSQAISFTMPQENISLTAVFESNGETFIPETETQSEPSDQKAETEGSSSGTKPSDESSVPDSKPSGEGSVPDSKASDDSSAPDSKASGNSSAPDSKASDDSSAPDSKASDNSSAPDSKASDDSSAPDSKASDKAEESETKASETKNSDTKTPETKAPETKTPESKTPETKVPETKAVETESTETDSPETEPALYTISITGGTVDGLTTAQYFEGEEVTIKADSPAQGKEFSSWSVISGKVSGINLTKSETSFAMPAQDIELEAQFVGNETYTVTLINGTVNGDITAALAPGETVKIEADTAPDGKEFDTWVIEAGNISLKSSKTITTTFTMPEENVTLKATFKSADYTAKVTTSDTIENITSAMKHAGFDSNVNIKNRLLSALSEEDKGYDESDTVMYDINYEYSYDDGKTWITDQGEKFPQSGKTITLPYPAGTNKDDYDFTVIHMFSRATTVDDVSYSAGDVEIPDVTLKTNGIQVQLYSFSPVLVAYKDKGSAAGSVSEVTLNESSITIHGAKQTFQLEASISPENASNQNVTWSSSDSQVADVDSKGLVTSYVNGTAIVTVTTEDGNKTAQCEVKVQGSNLKRSDLETGEDSGATIGGPTDRSGSGGLGKMALIIGIIVVAAGVVIAIIFKKMNSDNTEDPDKEDRDDGEDGKNRENELSDDDMTLQDKPEEDDSAITDIDNF